MKIKIPIEPFAFPHVKDTSLTQPWWRMDDEQITGALFIPHLFVVENMHSEQNRFLCQLNCKVSSSSLVSFRNL